MRNFLNLLRRWMVPAIFVALAALLTVPWSFWVILAAYERDVNEKARMLAERVRIQMSTAGFFISPQQVLNAAQAEILGDPTVQAVCFFDESATHAMGGRVRRHEKVPIPHSLASAEEMLNADPNSYRAVFRWPQPNGTQRVVYIDLSRGELKRHFRLAYWPLLRNVIALTATGLTIMSAAFIFAHHLWGQSARQRFLAEMEQQGLLAERVLTAAVLAHEIRNPLAALRFQLHSLRRNAADPERVGSTADTIDSELLRIQQLVQDYLAHEKAQGMRVSPVDLGEAVRTLQTLMGEMLRETGTRLTVARTPHRVVVACDPHALRQVLINLVVNAQQAMGHGGTITLHTAQQDGFGTISVSDTGPGIPPEMRDRLFKPFATSRKEGSGIGLALVKRFVDNFGGSVWVESEVGRGATFHLKLPLAGAGEPRGQVEPGQPNVAGATT